jgi:hypothetical protein
MDAIEHNLEILHSNGRSDEFESRIPNDFGDPLAPTVREVFNDLIGLFPELNLIPVPDSKDQ